MIKGILAGALFLMVSMPACGFTGARTVESLNGEWRFIADPAGSGAANGWTAGLPDSARTVQVPHTWNVEPGLEDFRGLAWYEKKFHSPADWRGKHVRLRFAAVYHSATVYLNGKKVGENLHSGYTTFYVDISGHIARGGENTLVVLTDNSFSGLNLPYKDSFDWPNDGGLIRDVWLEVSGKPSIRYAHIAPAINFSDTSATASLSIRLWEDVRKANFAIAIRERESQKMVWSGNKTLTRTGDAFQTSFQLDKAHLWHFDDPFLYEAEVAVIDKGVETDRKIERFGFRKVELRGQEFLLNNEPVRLPGIEYMPSSYPGYGAAEPKWVMDSVAHMMKDLNVAITRFHWQVDEYMLDLLDEKGVLVQAEIPWWQQPGKLSPALKETAKRQLTAMIERDFNRPSIFAWGISNEVYSEDSEQFYVLVDFVKKLDSTRLVNIVSNETFKRKEKDESLIGDLPTWNDYVGTWYNDDMYALPEYFETIESFLGNRPLLITEHGLCEPRFTGGDLKRVESMIYHYREWAKRPYIAGCIYFSLNDYRTHRGEDGSGSLKARVHGVTDLYFNKKPSYYAYKQLASPVEIGDVKKKNDSTATVHLRNKNSLPSYTLRGYRVSWMTKDGERRERMLPEMKPGDSAIVVMEDMHPRFAFEIISPAGFKTAGYPY